jgi:hypothetical protein
VLKSLQAGTATINVENTSREYDGTTQAGNVRYSITSPTIAGSIAAPTSLAFTDVSSKNVGTYKVGVKGISQADYQQYDWKAVDGDLTITRKALTTNTTITNKVYDGTRTATVAQPSTLSGVIAGDTVSLEQTNVLFLDKNAAINKEVRFNNALSGTDSSNYSIASGTANATISPNALSVSSLKVADKVYDGTTSATVTDAGTLSGVLGTDEVRFVVNTVEFLDKHVGTNKGVGVITRLTGADAGNYTLLVLSGGADGVTASITPKTLTLSSLQVADKTYDGTTNATVTTAGTLVGKIISDDVSLDNSNVKFADKNAGNNKAIRVDSKLTGADQGNYTLNVDTGAVTANIARKLLAVTQDGSAQHKVYDGTTTATFSASTVDGVVQGDNVTLSNQGNFADKRVGIAKEVTYNRVLTGNDAANYTVVSDGLRGVADITARAITIDATALSKEYDGTLAARVNVSKINNLVAGDEVSLGAVTGQFDTRDVGNNKAVTLSGTPTLNGQDAANYVLTVPTNLTGNITPKAIAIVADAKTKTERNLDPTLTYQFKDGMGLVQGDTLSGGLSRDSGEAVGQYAINRGSLGQADGNYSIVDFTPSQLTIAAIVVPPTPTPVILSLNEDAALTAVFALTHTLNSYPTVVTRQTTTSKASLKDTKQEINVNEVAPSSSFKNDQIVVVGEGLNLKR